jgi:arabinofuranan 3-O-arabinosyltransferase
VNSVSPDIGVVVPTRNSERTLQACLQSLRDQTLRPTIVVVDNHSSDSTAAIAQELADVFVVAGPERSAQRNRGAEVLGDVAVVGFVDSDMVLQPTVVQEVIAAIGQGAGSVIVPERTVGNGFWVEVRAFERSFYDGSDAIEAARFFTWDVFKRTGGFDEQLTGPEDWDLSEAARALAPVARTMAFIEHDEGTISYLGACRKKAYYAEGVRRYVAKRGWAAVSHASRRPWLHHPQALLSRHGAGLVALKAGEAVAVLAAVARGRAPAVRTKDVHLDARPERQRSDGDAVTQ